jgi:hypothetical protein
MNLPPEIHPYGLIHEQTTDLIGDFTEMKLFSWLFQ